MLLAAGSVSEFLRLIQIISWIVLPVMALVAGITVYVHYRKKKKNREAALAADEILPLPATLADHGRGADYIHFDHTGLVQQYHKRLCHLQAKYTALRQKSSALEIKCMAFAVFASGGTNAATGIKSYQALKAEADHFIKKYNAEKKEWENTSERLAFAYRILEKEYEALLFQLQPGARDPGTRLSAVDELLAENALLRDQLAGQEYLTRLLEEKERQILALQKQ